MLHMYTRSVKRSVQNVLCYALFGRPLSPNKILQQTYENKEISAPYFFFLMTAFSLFRILSLCFFGLFKKHWVRTSQGEYLIILFSNERKGYREGKKL